MTRPQPAARNRIVYAVSRAAMLLVSRLWFRLTAEGSERLPADRPVLLVGEAGIGKTLLVNDHLQTQVWWSPSPPP